jgi:hypothetical protein
MILHAVTQNFGNTKINAGTCGIFHFVYFFFSIITGVSGDSTQLDPQILCKVPPLHRWGKTRAFAGVAPRNCLHSMGSNSMGSNLRPDAS